MVFVLFYAFAGIHFINRTLNASGLLEELDRRHGTKLSIVCDSAEQMVKYKGYHEQIMSAKDDVDAFWKVVVC